MSFVWWRTAFSSPFPHPSPAPIRIPMQAWYAWQTGVSAVRSQYIDNPSQTQAYSYASTQYQLGSAIISSPITWLSDPSTNATQATVWLSGAASDVWSNWNGTASWPGGTVVTATYGLGDIPLFASAAQLVPLQTNASVWTPYADLLLWAAWPGATSGLGSAYEDDSESLAYESAAGAVASATYTASTPQWSHAPAGTTITVQHSGWTGAYAGAPVTRSTGVQVSLGVCVGGMGRGGGWGGGGDVGARAVTREKRRGGNVCAGRQSTQHAVPRSSCLRPARKRFHDGMCPVHERTSPAHAGTSPAHAGMSPVHERTNPSMQARVSFINARVSFPRNASVKVLNSPHNDPLPPRASTMVQHLSPSHSPPHAIAAARFLLHPRHRDLQRCAHPQLRWDRRPGMLDHRHRGCVGSGLGWGHWVSVHARRKGAL